MKSDIVGLALKKKILFLDLLRHRFSKVMLIILISR